jgi:hypothetical protein
VQLKAHDAAEVEQLLAALREAASASKTSRSAAPTWRTCSSRSCRRRGRDPAGCRTLFYKEVLRFWKVGFQTVAAPVLTAVLYLLIFGHVLEGPCEGLPGRGLHQLPGPGLVMMSVLQNAFANSSAQLVQSKITGNLVFLLLTPLSHWAWFVAYVGRRWCAAWWWAAGRAAGHRVVRAAAWPKPAVDRWCLRAGRRACWARWA